MISFTCKLCGTKHFSHEKFRGYVGTPSQDLAKIPHSIMSSRDSQHAHYLHCRDGCRGHSWETKVVVRGEFWCDLTLPYVANVTRCQKCNNTFKRVRVMKSLTWEIKDACDCHRKGMTVPFPKLTVPERVAILIGEEDLV